MPFRPDHDPPALDRSLPVVLLRTDRNPFHHGTLGAIRSLGRAGVPVHALLEDRLVPAAHSRHLRGRHPWGPSPRRDPGALTKHLHRVAARAATRPGVRPLLVPLDDAGAIFIAERAHDLSPAFDFPEQEPSAPVRVADKSMLLAQCDRYGIDCPESVLPGSRAELDEAVAHLGLPLVAKWSRPWLLPRGHRSTVVLDRAAAVHRLFDLAGTEPCAGAGPLILQRRIPPDGGDWFFHGHFDRDQNCVFGGTGRKHLAHPPEAGHTVAGEWVLNPVLEGLAHKIVTMLGVRGIVDLDFRFDTVTGTYRLLDFNPRLGAQFRLFHDAGGLDLVRALHLERSGRDVPTARPRYGRTLLVEHQFLHHTLTRPGPRATSCRKVYRALRTAAEPAWFAADDPLPFLTLGMRVMALGMRSVVTGRGKG
ncbi:ATP-grasp domain-containing protein [Actinomadura sp. SCN-SB]|uniref:carboxylate--amine ligase n=1 Tax=Actinomadura sp. SCN-SB TaxID=3373092 RepID=UPI0037502251